MNVQKTLSAAKEQFFLETYQVTKKSLSKYVLRMLQDHNKEDWCECNDYGLFFFKRDFVFFSCLRHDTDTSPIKEQLHAYIRMFKAKNCINLLYKKSMRNAFKPLIDDVMTSQQTLTVKDQNGLARIITLEAFLKEQDCGLVFYSGGFRLVTHYNAVKKAQKWYNWRFWFNLFS